MREFSLNFDKKLKMDTHTYTHTHNSDAICHLQQVAQGDNKTYMKKGVKLIIIARDR